ncbi:UDP-N-acetylmuramate--L-alanine ligase [Prochlorococcus marinus]|uniref:UDP-N-acetylmuramate--L-alanine ligase n=1 Tax=Prochlorococcus marinus (strain MIT 9211) TaxID=93059 RepID=A9B9L8_PROM4|nr:UDP-N-acetylmuramate--L-alanine ligase [Prochlorococcus marinus]ABX07953.1 Probable UDP-N-acetylmuramate-alanine ligase [Prochlorococcus marinus str. MIT 9211]
MRHIHFIGIGGIGMSAIALILVKRGYSISGSDQKSNNAMAELSNHGVQTFTNQSAKNIQIICKNMETKPIIIISSAIFKANPELQEAYRQKLKVFHRSDILAWLIKQQPSIVVAGSHGKTTTSTIITTLLALNKEDPTALIGGVVPFYKSNGHAGKGKFLVAEADESDGTLVKFEGDIGIITNIELDHTDYYKDLESLKETMEKFSKSCKKVLANHDCPNLQNKSNKNINWWSTQTIKGVDFSGIPTSINGNETTADFYEKETFLGEITVPLPGLHNLSNAVGAIAACRLAGLSFSELKNSLKDIKPPNRRFDFKGQWQGRQIVDDYAHHPSEINATIETARLMINTKTNWLPKISKRLVVVFQPHRYTRTKHLIKDFAKSLGKADIVFLAPIYSAGEEMISDVSINSLFSLIKKEHPNISIYTSTNMKELESIIKKNTIKDDLILFMGAGNINMLSKKLLEKSKTNKNQSKHLVA